MTNIQVTAASLAQLIEELFVALGAAQPHAACLADSLVAADLEGVASHGVALVPMYVERVRAGSVSLTATPVIVEDHGGLVVMSPAIHSDKYRPRRRWSWRPNARASMVSLRWRCAMPFTLGRLPTGRAALRRPP